MPNPLYRLSNDAVVTLQDTQWANCKQVTCGNAPSADAGDSTIFNWGKCMFDCTHAKASSAVTTAASAAVTRMLQSMQQYFDDMYDNRGGSLTRCFTGCTKGVLADLRIEDLDSLAQPALALAPINTCHRRPRNRHWTEIRRLPSGRGLLRANIQQGQQVLRRLIVGRLTFTPQPGGYYTFSGCGTVEPLLAGVIRNLASPTGLTSW
jgi:hypothetical protein